MVGSVTGSLKPNGPTEVPSGRLLAVSVGVDGIVTAVGSCEP